MNLQDLPTDPSLLFERQRAAAAKGPAPRWEARAERLRRLQRLLLDNEAAIARAIDADFGGRPAIETELAEVWPSLEEIKGALRHGRGWMKPRRAGVGKWFVPARAQVLPQPLGVVGIIVPWNYPLYLAIGPMAAALAAGNRVMVKMSELTPRLLRAAAATVRPGLRVRGGLHRHRRSRGGGAVQHPALRPPAVHRLHGGGPQGDGRGRRQPDAGDAGAGRQVAGRRHPRLPARACRAAHPRRQAAQCRADLHRPRLRAAAPRPGCGFRRGGAAGSAARISGGPRGRQLLQRRERAPLPPPGARAGGSRASAAPAPNACSTARRATTHATAWRPCC